MTDFQRAEVTKELIRAQDALHSAFQAACKISDLDLAKHLREQRKSIGDTITRINGGPVRLTKPELLEAFR